ncbi:Two-component response regulator, SAPR family, consists of REC, wHTH and BTAD domains [Paenibacillus sp. 1_12]|nr:Two-component response regulator, SAPR family, consists of REC, wHTH and BTAD domains [Paenibacillus sp. 1_12]
MYTAIIVEDETPILNLMKYVIGQNRHFTIIGTFTSSLEALSCLTELQPDVAFLDVEMPRMNGLELAEKICEVSEHTKIIFTTAFKHYALEAFKVYAFDYILKPVMPVAIDRIANRLIKLHRTPDERQTGAASIRCFGGFEVRNREGGLVRFPTRKTEELFAFFLCHPGQDLSKWRLADVLWMEMIEDRASHNLHNTIYRLKKLLKEQEIDIDIQKTHEGYMLEPADHLYDVLEYGRYDFSLAERSQDTSKLEQLWSLYKGPLLEGKDYLWKAPLEEGFCKQYTVLTRSLIQLDLVREEWKKSEYRLEAYLSLYPLHEEMNQILLDLYWRFVNKEKIAKHYAKYEAAIRLEMGMEPSQEMKSRIVSYLA